LTYLLDHKREGGGFVEVGVAGENLGAKKLVYRNVLGVWRLADSDAAATMPVIGMTIGAIPSGRRGNIFLQGFIGDASWAWIIGDEVYASQTPGELTQTLPSGVVFQQVAIAYEGDLIYFNPSLSGAGGASCTLLEGSTAYVGFDECKQSYVNYWYCDGVADDVQINTAQAYATALGGGSIEFERGVYTLAAPIVPTGNDLWFKGQGTDTLIDGDGLATTEHCFHITARTDIRITDMQIQTQGGGTKTCHCIFIEDGSDGFHIDNVEISDSDDNGIHIEGTSTVNGHIHTCHIEGTDGHGVYVNMDGGETIESLHVSDNEIQNTGGSGIYFDASGGNDACIIDMNIISSPTGVGIYVNDFTGGQITGNISRNSGSHGIHVVGSDEVNVADNRCNGNVGHGILFESSSDEGLIDGNTCNDNDSGDSATYDGIHIATACTHNTVINNTCLRNNRHGIYVIGASNQISVNICGENGEDGIGVSGGDPQVNDNKIYDNSQNSAGTDHGIHIYGSGDRAIVKGNHIDGHGDSQQHGIYLGNGAVSCLIQGNHCQDGMGSGIYLAASNDNNSILGNFLLDNDDYGVEINAGTCDSNRVRNNTFDGNVTGAVSDSGTGTIFHTKQYYVARDDDNVGMIPGKSITNGQTAYIAVHAPYGLQQLMKFNIYVIPNATQAAADWDLETDYGAIGEASGNHGEIENAATYNVTDNVWFEIEAISLGMFASMVEEDTGGIGLTVSTQGHNVTVVMAEMYYV